MGLFSKKKTFEQSSHDFWHNQWQSAFPPECRDVAVTHDGVTYIAYVLVGHTAMMLQDGLLMQATFFDVCEHFQRAGYHVVWLMRCTQDIHNGYLKRKSSQGDRTTWLWKQPTTNFGRWSSDQKHASIILQIEELPDGNPKECTDKILQRVVWAESDNPEAMVPSRTVFTTVGAPNTPLELARWISGEPLSSIKSE